MGEIEMIKGLLVHQDEKAQENLNIHVFFVIIVKYPYI